MFIFWLLENYGFIFEAINLEASWALMEGIGTLAFMKFGEDH